MTDGRNCGEIPPRISLAQAVILFALVLALLFLSKARLAIPVVIAAAALRSLVSPYGHAT